MQQQVQTDVVSRLDKLDERMNELRELLLNQKMVKDLYTTAEVAKLIGKAEFTVREWCRNRRVHAEKRACGRGSSREWVVSHAELTRIRNEGLLPTFQDQD